MPSTCSGSCETGSPILKSTQVVHMRILLCTIDKKMHDGLNIVFMRDICITRMDDDEIMNRCLGGREDRTARQADDKPDNVEVLSETSYEVETSDAWKRFKNTRVLMACCLRS